MACNTQDRNELSPKYNTKIYDLVNFPLELQKAKKQCPHSDGSVANIVRAEERSFTKIVSHPALTSRLPGRGEPEVSPVTCTTTPRHY